jgi:dTDP-4-amino-4,6-dideoxygalactose transaminase
VQAALLLYGLRRYGRIIERRRHIASLYQERLGAVPELSLPPAPDADPRHFDIYQNYEVEAERRDGLKRFLHERGIGTLVQWGGQAIHQIRELGFTQSLPQTDALFRRLLMLPMNMSISVDDVEYISDCIRAFYGRN